MKQAILVVATLLIFICTANCNTNQQKYDKIFEGIDFLYFLKFEDLSYLDSLNLTKKYDYPSVIKLSVPNNFSNISNVQKLDYSLYVFFTAEDDIVPYLLQFQYDDSTLYTGFYKRFFEVHRYSFESSVVSSRKYQNDFDEIVLEKRYIALALLINYSINKQKEEKDVKLIAIDSFISNAEKHKDLLSQMYEHYLDLFYWYYKNNTKEFHKQVVHCFEKYVKDYKDVDFKKINKLLLQISPDSE